MKTLRIVTALAVAGLLGGCATAPRDVAKLDAQIAEVTKDPFGEFMYHESMAEENLQELRKIRQWWADNHYWNIDMEQAAALAAQRAAEHRKQSEAALVRWHDNCVRHHDMCDRLQALENLHGERLFTAAFFDTGSAEPRNIQNEQISKIVAAAKAYSDAQIELVAYTDTVGGEGANKTLAERRAEAVRNLLLKAGLPAGVKVHCVAVGEGPGPNNTANQQNRRVDIRIHAHDHHHHR